MFSRCTVVQRLVISIEIEGYFNKKSDTEVSLFRIACGYQCVNRNIAMNSKPSTYVATEISLALPVNRLMKM